MFDVRGMTTAAAVLLVFLASVLVAPADVSAQEPGECGGVDEGGCTINGEEACWIEAEQEFGSVEWEHSSGCLAECPDPEHCSPEFAQELGEMGIIVAELGGVITSSLHRNDPQTLLRVLNSSRVNFNVQRRAIQVYGCDTEVVIGHLRIPERYVEFVNKVVQTQ